jgi:phage N-6-adenine-methyltransferase
VAVSKTLYSRDSDEYQTPQYLYDFLDNIFHFTLDPCASIQIERQKKIDTKVKYTMDDNGLLKSWINYSTFINPPYSQIKRWIQKSIDEMDNRFETYGKTGQKPSPIVLLVPARTDTKWFHQVTNSIYASVFLLKGRLQFDKNKTSKAPFPSCVILLGVSSTMDKLATNKHVIQVPTWTLDLKP